MVNLWGATEKDTNDKMKIKNNETSNDEIDHKNDDIDYKNRIIIWNS